MCIREKHLFHNDISPHYKFLLSNERLDFLFIQGSKLTFLLGSTGAPNFKKLGAPKKF